MGKSLKPQLKFEDERARSSSPSRSPACSPAHKQKRKTPNQTNYGSQGVVDHDVLLLPASDYKFMLLLTALAVVVRLFRIYQPTSVVFDEVHFGGFATKYIHGRFFMDVHPPLAKLLITLAGFLAGFRGNFDFKDIGDDYLEPGVPYVAMRSLPAVLGVLSVPIMFLTLKAYGCRTTTASFGAVLLTFENALVTHSRLILLDSPLVFFTSLTALSWVSFMNQHEQGPHKAFDPSWWFWLISSGVCLGLTASVKWVGLFTIAWVGSLTVLQLWVLLGDFRTVTPNLWFKHFFARAVCLIVIPVGIYMSMFAIHFLCLPNPGEGDGFMSSEFQATLNSNAMLDVPVDVYFGSRVSIRHLNTKGGYLHSHPSLFPGGSQQQQITLYPHKDTNNLWLIENQTQPLDANGVEREGVTAWDNITKNYIHDGDIIKLTHIETFRRLHSHDHRPPVTEADWQFEVSAYGFEGFPGDANDLFRVEIVGSKSKGDKAKERLRTIETKFRLIHIMTGCALFSHTVKLPPWGFDQQEVTCARGGSLPNSLWYIEYNDHPTLDSETERVNYDLPGFFGKFWELHKVMWKTNAGLTDPHTWETRPSSWPLLLRGINMWGRNNRQIYLIGNPFIWYSSTVAILIYIIFKGIAILRWQRSCNDYSNINFKRFDYELGQTILGWAFHYFPFYLMVRQLFLHHYLPALYFAIMAFCQVVDFAVHRINFHYPGAKTAVGIVFMVLFTFLSIFTFHAFSPLAYGNPWTRSKCEDVKLFNSWDFDCNLFFENLSDYDYTAPAVFGAGPTLEGDKKVQRPEVDLPADIQDQLSSLNLKPGQQVKQEVEYRDEHGNILNEEEVASLQQQGEVSFKIQYETKEVGT